MRVDSAYHHFWTIPIEDYPEHVRGDRAEIDRLLTRLPSREGYIIPDNLRRMTNKTASRIAKLIYSTYGGLHATKQERGDPKW